MTPEQIAAMMAAMQEPEPPTGACPQGCDAGVDIPEFRDGNTHDENRRCRRCGTIWKEET